MLGPFLTFKPEPPGRFPGVILGGGPLGSVGVVEGVIEGEEFWGGGY